MKSIGNGEVLDFKREFLPEFQELFQLIWKKEYKREVWEWQYEKNPFGKPIIKIYQENGRIAGFYAIIPRKLFFPKIGLVDVMYSLDTITHPDYKGRGIFPYLAKLAYEDAFKKKKSLIFGFPNQNSKYSFEMKLNWKINPITFSFEFDLKNLSDKGSISRSSEYIFNELKNFDKEIDDFWDQKKDGENQINSPRTSEYLNWRFVRNPMNQYERYSVRTKGEKLVGYFVLKKYNEITWHIVDFLCDDERIFASIFLKTLDLIDAARAKKISLWNTHNRYSEYLKQFPFSRMDLKTTFGFLLNPIIKFDSPIEEKRWNITMSDSDVF